MQKDCLLLMENENSFSQGTLLTSINTHHMSGVSANIPTVPPVYLTNGHCSFLYFSRKRKLAIRPAGQQVHSENLDNPLPNLHAFIAYFPHPQSLHSPEQILRFPEVEASRFQDILAHEGGKIASPKHRLPFAPGNIPGTHVC